MLRSLCKHAVSNHQALLSEPGSSRCQALARYAVEALPSAIEARKGQSPLLRPLDVTGPGSLAGLIPPLRPREAGPDSLRAGLIGIKVGMVSEWNEFGVLTPLSVLWFDDNQVTQVKVPPHDCTTALQIEMKVSPDALMPVGTSLNAAHFVPGQHVDIQAHTKGKGFQGVMKRFGFSGQPRTHGASLSHRSIGSIGRQGYSRVLPGRKMPGRMGGIKSKELNCWVHRIDAARNLMFVTGTLPGPQGCFMLVRDAHRKAPKELPALPFPTCLGDASQQEPMQATPKKNAYDAYRN